MRQIIFRGKRKADNTMLFGDLNHISGLVYIFPRGEDTPLNSVDWFEVDPETVGQSVGLNDKNGNPVYEGDVIQWSHLKNSPVIVYYNDNEFVFVGRPVYKDEETESWLDGQCEILGNIHQDKHLLL